jgi:hypothetical protein
MPHPVALVPQGLRQCARGRGHAVQAAPRPRSPLPAQRSITPVRVPKLHRSRALPGRVFYGDCSSLERETFQVSPESLPLATGRCWAVAAPADTIDDSS